MAPEPNTFWSRRATCSHAGTPEISDQQGICPRCGATVTLGLRERDVLDTIESIFRWPHKRACVKTDNGWVCADRCPIGGGR